MKALLLTNQLQHLCVALLKQDGDSSSHHHYAAATHSASESIDFSCLQHTCALNSDLGNILFNRIFYIYIFQLVLHII